MQDTHRIQETYPQEGIDSKAYLLCFLRRIPIYAAHRTDRCHNRQRSVFAYSGKQ